MFGEKLMWGVVTFLLLGSAFFSLLSAGVL